MEGRTLRAVLPVSDGNMKYLMDGVSLIEKPFLCGKIELWQGIGFERPPEQIPGAATGAVPGVVAETAPGATLRGPRSGGHSGLGLQ